MCDEEGDLGSQSSCSFRDTKVSYLGMMCTRGLSGGSSGLDLKEKKFRNG